MNSFQLFRRRRRRRFGCGLSSRLRIARPHHRRQRRQAVPERVQGRVEIARTGEAGQPGRAQRPRPPRRRTADVPKVQRGRAGDAVIDEAERLRRAVVSQRLDRVKNGGDRAGGQGPECQ